MSSSKGTLEVMGDWGQGGFTSNRSVPLLSLLWSWGLLHVGQECVQAFLNHPCPGKGVITSRGRAGVGYSCSILRQVSPVEEGWVGVPSQVFHLLLLLQKSLFFCKFFHPFLFPTLPCS